jgi:hypothetical protein
VDYLHHGVCRVAPSPGRAAYLWVGLKVP